jgi:hypothetical protein
MRAFALCTVFLAGILAAALLGQQQLDNKAIVKLHNAGLTDETILNLINTQPGQYATGVNDIIALKQAGISEKIIRALASRVTPPAASPAASPTATPQGAAPPTAKRVLTEIFYKKDNQWVSMQPEEVSWKAGGILKSVATLGVKKRDIDGAVAGASSKNKLRLPGEFVLYIPGGVDLREYRLLHLRPREGVREFRAAIEDDFHISGGRDLVPFDGTPVPSRGFLITLKDLSPGEYGWGPPEAALSAHDATAPPGKIFTFVVE